MAPAFRRWTITGAADMKDIDASSGSPLHIHAAAFLDTLALAKTFTPKNNDLVRFGSEHASRGEEFQPGGSIGLQHESPACLPCAEVDPRTE